VSFEQKTTDDTDFTDGKRVMQFMAFTL